MHTTNVTHFAGTDFRNTNQIFGVKDVPHRQDGHRKSTLIETMVLQDIRRGRGVALIDPHADLVERVVAQVPPQRAAHVIYLNAADPSQPHGEDPLRHVREDRIALADLGDALGIAFQQVQKYENGTNRIGLPASPPREKAAACTHKTRQSSPAAGPGTGSPMKNLRIILETASWLNATPAFANPRATRAASVPEPTGATDLTPARVNDRQGHSAQSLSQGGEAPAMRPYRPRRQAHNRGRPVLKPRPSTGCLKSIRREAASSAARTTRSTANFWLSMKPPDS
jgi:hypothetical protein